jgi:glyoxylase-like metal-dependent hydrolase (beta-lactamase superfamily II)
MKGIKLYVLATGVLPQDKSILIAGLTQATEKNRNPVPVWSRTPTYAVLIEHPAGYVLFDTSVNPEGMTKRFPQALKTMNNYEAADDEQFPARLAQLKVKPEQIKYIVMSHMHFDHAGNLELFTNAEITVHEDEFAQAYKAFGLNGEMGVFVWEDLHQIALKKLNWKLLPANVEKKVLLPGLTIYNFGSGHSYGMLGLLVELESAGNILLVADAIYTSTNYGPPLKPPGIIYDSIGWARTVEKIREIATEKNAQVWFGHDEDQLKTLKKSTEGYYE